MSTATLAIAKALGARVIVTRRSESWSRQRARCDGTRHHDTDDVVAEVKGLTGGGAHVVIVTSARAWKRTLDAARRRGSVSAARRGPPARKPPSHLVEALTIWFDVGNDADFEAVYELVKSGRVLPVVDEVLPLAEVAAAHERLEAGQQLGKIVLRIPA
jgi:NADPH:quinone reductase-like Zn-dependent oxidoreductase